MSPNSSDRRVLKVARAVEDTVTSATVVLFGSRAGNRHSEM